MDPPPANICLECGICCDGTLFARLPPPAAYVPPGPGQPCPAHRLACTLYKERPQACRVYRCALLRRVDAGEIDRAAALSVIDRARSLRDEARAGIEGVLGAQAGAGLVQVASRFTALIDPDDGPLREHPHRDRARALLGELDALLDEHFRPAAGPDRGPPG